MIVGQVLSGIDDTVHISFHEFCDDVNILVSGWGRGPGYIKNLNDIFVFKEFQKPNFSNYTLCIYEIFESLGDFLDSHFLVRLMIVSTADNAISSVSDLLNVLKLIVDTECSS